MGSKEAFQERVRTPRGGFAVAQLVPSVTSGILTGLITIAYAISFAALAYGDQPAITTRGIGLTLAGAVVIRLIVSWFGSYANVVALPQDTPAAILGLTTAALVSSMADTLSADDLFVTIIAAVMLTDLLLGIFFILLGTFNLGNLIRFLPYPVIGGFLAGTGYLLVLGGLGVMTNLSLSLTKLPLLLQSGTIYLWLPGAIFAFSLLFILQRLSHFSVLPGLLIGALALFYLAVWLTGTPLTTMMAQGWLMGPFPEGGMWNPVGWAKMGSVQWPLIFGQLGNIATALLISTVALLLNATGLELIYNRDLDLNKELRAAGWANLAMIIVGGLPGYQGLSLSSLQHKISNQGRISATISGIVVLMALFFGADLLELIPRFVMGGIVAYLGLSLLKEWLYSAWFKFSLIDYGIILTIVVVIATVGFLEGVLLGTVMALILFVVNYSQINVVKHSLSGANYQSRVTRGQPQRQFLNEEGASLYILELQGFIFFGTANNLLQQLNARLIAPDLPQLRYVLFDFRQVTGIDSTALLGFVKIKQLAEKHGILLVLTNVSADMRYKFDQEDLSGNSGVIRYFVDLDHGMEWCENQLLTAADLSLFSEHEHLLAYLLSILPNSENMGTLISYFDRLEVDHGDYLMHQGDRPDALYFVESGQITAQLEYPDRDPLRLETMRGGRVVGEIGFYLSSDRTASVVADAPSVVYRFSLDTLKQIEKSDPAAASTFHQIIVHLLSHRLTHLIRTVRALQH